MANDPNTFRFTSPNNSIDHLCTLNRSWSTRTAQHLPSLFTSNAAGQHPQILWVGCSDSRVPETTVLDLLPGEVFVHRNIANLLPPGDLCSLSVVQYAVEVLQVKHVIVCGHYGCGGVIAALGDGKHGLVDYWLQHLRGVRASNEDELAAIADPIKRAEKLVEFNVIAQVNSLRRQSMVQEAVKGRGLEVHGFVYDPATGRCRILEVPADVVADSYRVGPK